MSIPNPYPNIADKEINDAKTWSSAKIINELQPALDTEITCEETYEGNIVTFNNLNNKEITSLDCKIIPIQEGTGTPSPSNPRPISGTSVLDIYHSGADTSDYDTTSVPLGRTVYGGSADVVGGVGTDTYIKHEFSSSEIISDNYISLNSSTNVWYWTQNNLTDISGIDSDAVHYCNVLKQDANAYNGGVANAFRILSGNRFYITLSADDYPTKADFRNAIDTLKPVMVLKKTTPTDFTFTGQPIRSLLGVNNVWTDSGNIKVTTGETGTIGNILKERGILP